MRKDPLPADDDLVARCRAGDPTAWRSLYDAQFPFVFRVAIRVGASAREAADVAQEVFFRAWRSLGTFRGDAHLRTWLYRITVNEVFRAQRGAVLRRALGGLLGRAGGDEPTSPPPDRLVEQTEAFAELQEILRGIKPKPRAAFVLFEIEELSLEETAEVLGCPLQTVRSRLRIARQEFERLKRQRAAVRAAVEGGRR